MKPLREDHDPRHPEVARAVRLLEQVGPLPHSRLTQRRVRNKIELAERGKAALLLRPAVVVGVLCGLAATAGATYGVIHFTTSSASEPRAPQRLAPRAAPVAPKIVDARPAPARAPVAVPESEQPTQSTPAARGTAPRVAAHRASRPAKPSPASDAALVHGAVKELRNGGDPERARKLLDEYRSQNPSGVLAEEALALSIEAAAAEGDPGAKRLARQYLAKYPNGRFVAAARRVLH